MSNFDEALEALNAGPNLTPEQYTEWLRAGEGKFYDFFREYVIGVGHAEEQARIIKLLETHAYDYLTTTEAISRDLSEEWHTGFADAIALIKGKVNE